MYAVNSLLIFLLLLLFENVSSQSASSDTVISFVHGMNMEDNEEVSAVYVTTPVTGVSVEFTVSVPALRWTATGVCRNGEFTTIQLPDDLGQSGVAVWANNGEEITLISGNFGVNELSSDLFQPFVTHTDQSCAGSCFYYGVSYGWQNFPEFTSFLSAVVRKEATRIEIAPVVDCTVMAQGREYILRVGDDVLELDMNSFETIYITSSADLTGTIIQSTTPLSLTGGHQCVQIPNPKVSCSHISEQIPPLDIWETDYVAVPTKREQAYDIFRIVSAYDDTTVNMICSNRSSSSLLLNRGEFSDVTIDSTVACSVVANRIILLVQYSTGFSLNNISGDPFMALVPPVNWYSNNPTFVSPGHLNDGYPFENFANIIVLSDYYNLDDLYLDNVAFSEIYRNRSFESMSVGNENGQTYHTIQLSVNPGSHFISHSRIEATIGVTAYGLSDQDSYGYSVSRPGACRVPNVESSGGSFGKLPLEIPAGREINFECQSGFYLKEGGVLVCQHNGIWTGEVPRCERYCEPPPDPNNGLFLNVPAYPTPNTAITFNCDPDYNVAKGTWIVCLEDGTWSGEMPICAKTCPKPDPIGNGSFINLPEVHYLGDIVAPRCNFGFEMVVGGSLTCGENGRWEGYFPYCLYACPLPSPPESGFYSPEVNERMVRQGSIVTVACNEGYILYGTESLTCLENGTWQGNALCLPDVYTCPVTARERAAWGLFGVFFVITLIGVLIIGVILFVRCAATRCTNSQVSSFKSPEKSVMINFSTALSDNSSNEEFDFSSPKRGVSAPRRRRRHSGSSDGNQSDSEDSSVGEVIGTGQGDDSQLETGRENVEIVQREGGGGDDGNSNQSDNECFAFGASKVAHTEQGTLSELQTGRENVEIEPGEEDYSKTIEIEFGGDTSGDRVEDEPEAEEEIKDDSESKYSEEGDPENIVSVVPYGFPTDEAMKDLDTIFDSWPVSDEQAKPGYNDSFM